MAAQDSHAPGQLRSMSEPQSLAAYIGDLWRRRRFTMSLATGSLRAQHLDTSLGGLWHVLNPAMLMGVYYLVFGVLIGTSRGVDNFIGFLGIGIFSFAFCQRTVVACGSSIPNNLGLIRSLQFPRAVLPISTVIRELTGYGYAAAVMLLVLLLTREWPRPEWVLVPFVVVLMTIFSAGLGLIVARLTDRIRDVANVVPHVFRILFYVSGIIYSVEVFVTPRAMEKLPVEVDAAVVRQLFVLDPYYAYIEVLRDLLMSSYDAEYLGLAWLVSIVVAPVTFVIGVLYFRGGEKLYGRG